MFADINRQRIEAYGLRAALMMAVLLTASATATAEQWIARPLVDFFARATEWIVWSFGGDISRHGNILTHPPSGATVHVTKACDGLGVLAVFLAMLFASQLRLRTLFVSALAVVAILELFNLGRVITLFHLRSAPAGFFDITHIYIMPFTTALVGVFVISKPVLSSITNVQPDNVISGKRSATATKQSFRLTNHRAAFRTILIFVGYFIAAIFVWWFAGRWLLFPFYNLVIEPISVWISQSRLETISTGSHGEWILQTRLAKPENPAALFNLPLEPRYFTLGLPLLWAFALSVAPRGQRLKVFLLTTITALVFMAVTLLLQTYTAVPKFAASTGATIVYKTGPLGQLVPSVYVAPGQTFLAIIDGLRFVLVHINLFLLPFLLPLWALAITSTSGNDRPANSRSPVSANATASRSKRRRKKTTGTPRTAR